MEIECHNIFEHVSSKTIRHKNYSAFHSTFMLLFILLMATRPNHPTNATRRNHPTNATRRNHFSTICQFRSMAFSYKSLNNHFVRYVFGKFGNEHFTIILVVVYVRCISDAAIWHGGSWSWTNCGHKTRRRFLILVYVTKIFLDAKIPLPNNTWGKFVPTTLRIINLIMMLLEIYVTGMSRRQNKARRKIVVGSSWTKKLTLILIAL